MKLTETEVSNIVHYFESVTDAKSLARVLNQIYDLIYPAENRKYKAHRFEGRTLNYFAFRVEKRYTTFSIPKKSGGAREISAPVNSLKSIQRCLNVLFQCLIEPHKAAHGFLPERSIVTNAQKHVGKRFVYNIDIEGFFPNTSIRKVIACLMLPPFNLKTEEGKPAKLAVLLAKLCCDNDCLPQGAPTSPILTNLVCRRLDSRLARLAREHKAVYTRYADDITFSGNRPFSEEFKASARETLAKDSYRLNEAKERTQVPTERQEVTGLTVNQRVNVNRQYIRDLDFMLKLWERAGRETAEKIFAERYPQSKGHARNSGRIPKMELVLSGKIYFLGMVRGHEDVLYLRFKTKLLTLFDETNKVETATQQESDKVGFFSALQAAHQTGNRQRGFAKNQTVSQLPAGIFSAAQTAATQHESPTTQEIYELPVQQIPTSLDQLTEILDIWEQEGLEKAINKK